jgi:transcriptional regulator with XRE-family HTH domain
MSSVRSFYVLSHMVGFVPTGIRWWMDFLEQVGLSIQRIRRSNHLSQEKVAHDAGIDQAYLSRIEAGRSNIGLRMLLKMSQAMGVKPSELLKDVSPDSVDPG